MKVFELIHPDENKEWFTGKNIIQALSNYTIKMGVSLQEIEDCNIVEIPHKELFKYAYKKDNAVITNFENWLNENNIVPEIIRSIVA